MQTYEINQPSDYSGDPAAAEDTGLLASPEQGNEADDWDFWNSEYWIVRDTPPYRV